MFQRAAQASEPFVEWPLLVIALAVRREYTTYILSPASMAVGRGEEDG